MLSKQHDFSNIGYTFMCHPIARMLELHSYALVFKQNVEIEIVYFSMERTTLLFVLCHISCHLELDVLPKTVFVCYCIAFTL